MLNGAIRVCLCCRADVSYIQPSFAVRPFPGLFNILSPCPTDGDVCPTFYTAHGPALRVDR